MPMGDVSLGQALLAPTRIYVKTILSLLENHTIDGLAHITGGGISENIVRVLPEELGMEIDLSAWELPGVFRWLQDRGNIEESEMLRTFNCGIGMVLIVAEDQVETVSQALTDAGETSCRLGHVIDCADSSGRVRYVRS